jgi:hypothetical protein
MKTRIVLHIPAAASHEPLLAADADITITTAESTTEPKHPIDIGTDPAFAGRPG